MLTTLSLYLGGKIMSDFNFLLTFLFFPFFFYDKTMSLLPPENVCFDEGNQGTSVPPFPEVLAHRRHRAQHRFGRAHRSSPRGTVPGKEGGLTQTGDTAAPLVPLWSGQ